MRVSQRNYENLIAVLAFLSAVKLFFYGNKLFETISIIIIFCVLLFLFLLSNLVENTKSILLFALVGFSLIITAIVNSGWGAVLNYFILMLCSMLFSSYGCRERQLKKIFAISGIVTFIFLLSLQKYRNYSSFLFFTIFGSGINSNMVGMVALFTFFALLYVCISVKPIILRLVCVGIISIFCIYYIWIAECRSVLLAIAIFLLLCLIKKSAFKQNTFRKILCVLQFCSILFVFIYLYLYDISADINLNLWGKSFFSGREIVWNSVFEILARYPIIGSGGSIGLDSAKNTITMSGHNTIMSILYVFGIIPAVCYLIFFGKKYDNCTESKQCHFGQLVILSTSFITFVESFYTESYLCFLFMLFFISIVPQTKNKEKSARSMHDREEDTLLLVRRKTVIRID